MSICRLLYKEFLPTIIKIRKLNVQQPLPREQGINDGHKVKRQSISQERGPRQSSFVIRECLLRETQACLTHWPQPWERLAVPLIRNRGFMRSSMKESSCETACDTVRHGVLWCMGSQRLGHDWATELNWTESKTSQKTMSRIWGCHVWSYEIFFKITSILLKLFQKLKRRGALFNLFYQAISTMILVL